MPEPVMLSCVAMACRFELVMYGPDPTHLRAAGEEALSEIERLDAQLSPFRPESEIADINARAHRAPVKVDPRLVRFLKRLAQLSEETGGAFDPTVGPLMRVWGFRNPAPPQSLPSAADLEDALRATGMRNVLLDEDEFAVSFARPGVILDLGAVGKGMAIERAVASLRENGVAQAFIHGGTSTAYGIDAAPDGAGWPVEVRDPSDSEHAIATFRLRDAAMSVSAVHGRTFEVEGVTYGHVIDPRSGKPVCGALLAAVVTESAVDSDALSTALLTLGPEWLPELAKRRPGVRALVAWRDEENGPLRVASWPEGVGREGA